ncbi:exostosin 2 [Echinococcus multilocularis]|uniref:Exostosin 2 n=1 Tax=Echinococcus multilocularis TaxID=6211 RepID=A0A068Y745_ECHMU|nr:exostosin 2 [Echinococcus multilocularis]
MVYEKPTLGISAMKYLRFNRCNLRLWYIIPALFFITLLIFFTRPLEPVSNFAMLSFRVHKSQRFLYGSCSHHTCFNVELCEYEYPDLLPNRIRVYVYPELTFVDENDKHLKYQGSRYFRELLDALNSSKYAVSDPSEACLFVSSLNFEGNHVLSSSELLNMFLSFPWMNNRRNHLVFDLDYARSFDGNRFNLQSFPGMVAGSGFEYRDYRNTYDVSLPVVSSFQHYPDNKLERVFLLSAVQDHFSDYFQSYADKLLQNHRESDKLLSAIIKRDHMSSMFMIFKARDYSYTKISIPSKTALMSSLFCLVDQTQPPNTLLFDVMQAGCIPILLVSDVVLPFSEKLDWTKCSLSIPKTQLGNLIDVISTYSEYEIAHLQHHVDFFYSKYMSSLTAIVTTTLDIINSRVFPHNAPSYYDWNDPRLSLPVPNLEIAFPSNGQAICNRFTLILVTGSHIKYLVSTLRFMAGSKYIREAFIIWRGDMADVASPFFLQQSKLHIRILPPFYNSKEQAIVHLPETVSSSFLFIGEDAILPRNISEIDFAYEVWCQHPSRVITIVPFNNTANKTSPAADSIFAFFHKVFAIRVLELLPDEINSLIDSEMLSCAEVVLPELVVQLSGQPPMAVSARSLNSLSSPADSPKRAPVFNLGLSLHPREQCLKLLTINHLLPLRQENPSFIVYPL